MAALDPLVTVLIEVARPVLPHAIGDIGQVMTAGNHDPVVIVKQVIGVCHHAGHVDIVAVPDVFSDHICLRHNRAAVFSLYQACPDRKHTDSVLCPLGAYA